MLTQLIDAVGNTPLVRLSSLERETPGVELWGKCEFFNPGGSIKDRAALRIIQDAVHDGRLTPERTLIDSTSGNTGIAYAWIGAALGIDVALVMPLNVAASRQRIAKSMGAELIFSDPMEQSDGAIRLVRKLVEENPDKYFYSDQYSNPSNPAAHYDGTGREVWLQTQGRITHFVAGIGTTGTLMGAGRRLKRENPAVQVIAIEPAEALHGLEGLKHMASSMVPAIYKESEIDRKIGMPTEESWAMVERLGHEEGLFVGHSSGATVAGSLRIAKELAQAGKPGVICAVLSDRADRYFEPLRWDEQSPW
jgi:cysteine synthase B